jgi:TonB family protein
MDAVGDILAGKDRSDLPWGMGTSLSVLLHAGVAAILVISALHRPSNFVQPRAVAVRLVQAGTLKGGPPVVEAPPEPVPEKPKIVKPAEEEPPAPSPKALLLPAKDKEKKKPSEPVPQSKTAPREPASPPAPAAAPGARPGTGGPAGAGGTVGVGGATFDQPDFHYSYYVERMLVTIGMNWFKPAESVPISPMIERDGTISEPQLERSSGLPFVDRAALRAVMASSPLPPLPQEFGGKYLGVHLIFE